MAKNRLMLALIYVLAVSSSLYAGDSKSRGKDKNKSKSGNKILVEEFKDRLTGCTITYEYYKAPDGKKVMHGKYKRQWSIPKTDRSNWSGREVVTATFENNRLNGVVTIKCEKYKWKRKSEFVKGKGRKVSLVPVEIYVADNLKLLVKNDTLAEAFNFELGNLKYEIMGKINDVGEVQGTYTLYRRNMTEDTDNPRNIGQDWVVEEQYLCDPDYTYKDAVPKLTEINLGYPGTSRGEHIRIKIPRLRLSIAK